MCCKSFWVSFINIFQVWHSTAHDTGITKMPLMGKFFGTFANYEKWLLASACLTMCLCPSVRNNLAPLDGISWNLILETSIKIGQENSSFVKIKRKYQTLFKDLHTSMTMFCWILPRLRNLPIKFSDELKTYFVSNIFPRKLCLLQGNYEKYSRVRQVLV